MEEVPPRIIVREARKRSGKKSTSKALTPQIDATPERVGEDAEFPVLDAFQEYLNKERTRVRKRITGMAVVFSIVLIAVIAGGYILVRGWVDSLRTEVQQVAQDAHQDLQSSEDRIDAHAEKLESTESAFASLQSALASEETQRNSQNQQIEGVLSVYSNDVSALQGLVTRLEEEKQSLSTRLNEMGELLPELTEKIQDLEEKSKRPPMQALTVARTGAPETRDIPSSGNGRVDMLILPDGLTQAVRWRQPIPE